MSGQRMCTSGNCRRTATHSFRGRPVCDRCHADLTAGTFTRRQENADRRRQRRRDRRR